LINEKDSVFLKFRKNYAVLQRFAIRRVLYRIFAPLSLFIVNIFVGNLAWGVDDVALQEAFEAHGEVERAKVIHDRETGRSRGFGFVEMPNQEEAQAALEAMEGKELMGREIRCNESEARERR
jgi:RNA recognition motif-containing protein